MKTNLMTCKTCGHSVASDARGCPQCGARYYSGVRLMLNILGCLAVMLAGWLYSQAGLISGARSHSQVWLPELLIFLGGVALMVWSDRIRRGCMRPPAAAAVDTAPPSTTLRKPPARKRAHIP
jgi:hypothetical protein